MNKQLAGLSMDVLQARSLLRSGHYNEAIRLLQQSLSKTPADSIALRYLADAYFQSRDWTNALLTVEALITSATATSYDRKFRIKVLSNMQRFPVAIREAEQYLSQSPDDLE